MLIQLMYSELFMNFILKWRLTTSLYRCLSACNSAYESDGVKLVDGGTFQLSKRKNPQQSLVANQWSSYINYFVSLCFLLSFPTWEMFLSVLKFSCVARFDKSVSKRRDQNKTKARKMVNKAIKLQTRQQSKSAAMIIIHGETK